MYRLARRSRLLALALGLCAAAGGRAGAQVPVDSARRDTTMRADSSAAAPAPVHRLTEAGAQLRIGSALYRVRVITPAAAPSDSVAHSDSSSGRDRLARPDSTIFPADTLAGRDSLGAARDTVHARQADTTDLGVRTTTVTAAVYGGNAAWLIVSAGGRGTQSALDSLYLAQVDLRPLHLGGSLGMTRIAAEFTADTLFAATSAPMGRRSLIAAMPPDAVVSAEQLEALLQVAPLQDGWSDSVRVALIAPPTIIADPGVVQVEGSERASTPLGPADCWVVVLRTARGEQRLWVTKDSRTVVLARQPLSDPVGGSLERTLIAWAPPASAQPAAASQSLPPTPVVPPPGPPGQAPVPAQSRPGSSQTAAGSPSQRAPAQPAAAQPPVQRPPR